MTQRCQIKDFPSWLKCDDKQNSTLSDLATDCVICSVRGLKRRHIVTTPLCLTSSFSPVHLSKPWSLSLLYWLISLAVSLCVTQRVDLSLCHSLSSLRETYWTSLLSIPLLASITAQRDYVKNSTSICLSWLRVCARVYALVSVSENLCMVFESVCVCVSAFICGVVLPFPAVSMFKASSCAVRMCLSLFSKNPCSAFYQRAELGRPGTVQGWAQIIKHQQILIHPDCNWLGVFAGLVWLGLVGHGGITVLECGGLVLLRDWRLFVVRCNWSWYWIRTDGDIPGDVRFVLTHQVSHSLS